MTKVDLITGFLGSGKTTFIKEYARYLVRQGKKVAIIASDYGAINVDRMILAEELGDSCHLEMVIGGDADCARRRLKTKLIAMAMNGYGHVIIEPSGIYDVDELYDMLYEEPLDRWYEMGSVITIVEAGIYDSLSEAGRYVLLSQVAKAGTVVLSKLEESKGIAESGKVEQLLGLINEGLEEYKCSRRVDKLFVWKQGCINDDDFGEISRSGYNSGEMLRQPDSFEGSFESLFFFHVKTEFDSLDKTIKSLFEDENAGNIIRLKGFIQNEAGEWMEVNATKEDISIKPISEGQDLFIVIGEKLSKEIISNYWNDSFTI